MNFIKITEQPSIHEDLEQKSVRELLEGINEEDRKVASAVHACIPQIEKLVNEIVERMHQGGRIFYLGAGTPVACITSVSSNVLNVFSLLMLHSPLVLIRVHNHIL